MTGITTRLGAPALDPERAAREALLRPLLEEVDAVAGRAMSAICAEMPLYRDFDPRMAADVFDQCRQVFLAVLASLIEARQLTLDDLTFQRSAAMRRARAGVPLENYLNAYRIGQQVLWDSIVEAGRADPAGHDLVLSFASEVMRQVNYAATHAAESYVEFRQYGLADAAAERRDLVDRLLTGRMPEQEPLLAVAERHGISAQTPALVAVAVPLRQAVDADGPTLASASLARAGLDAATRWLVAMRRRQIVIVIALCARADPEASIVRLEGIQHRLRAEGVPLRIGVSALATGVTEFPRAYAEAEGALGFLGKDGGIAALTRMSPMEYLMQCADATAVRLVPPRVARFVSEDDRRGGVLIATIRTYAECDMSLKETATRLQVHLNTVQYRFQRVEKLTELNPRRFADLQALLTAIALGTSNRVAAARDLPSA